MTSTSIYPEYPCITEKAIVKFKPTWLMIKRHRITGLFYFCKTTGKDPINYLGSGLWWVPHINKHGREHVETIWCELFDDIYVLVDYALTISKEYNIVASKEWANLIPENGLTGGLADEEHAKRFHRAGWEAMNKIKDHSASSKLAWERYKEKRLASPSYQAFFKAGNQAACQAALTEEARAKRKATMAEHEHQQGKKNSQFGKQWINKEGYPSLIVKKEELDAYLLLGYSLGRIKKIEKPSRKDKDAAKYDEYLRLAPLCKNVNCRKPFTFLQFKGGAVNCSKACSNSSRVR